MPIMLAAALPIRAAVVVRFTADATPPAGLPAPLAAALRERLARDAMVLLPTLGHLPQPWLLVAKAPNWSSALSIRRRAGAIGRLLVTARADSIAIVLPDALTPAHLDPLLIGLDQGAYAFDRYLPERAPRLPTLTIVRADFRGALAKTWTQTAHSAEQAAMLIRACRDQVNTPAEDMGPDEFTAVARTIAHAHGLRLRVYDEAACRRLKMGALLAVGRASPRRPRLLTLDYQPRQKTAKKAGKNRGFLALCGKGVCFDTGGLNIKTGNGMMLMRKDMGGAATVLAAIALIAARGGTQPVRAYLPLVDNSIAGNAFRPGDVLTASDGTTIEVGNTDAEGRLILADAIAQARRDGAGRIVTVATLTGAALVALGRIHVPLMGTDDALQTAIERAAVATGEKVWRLPMDDEHRAIMKGTTTVLTNDGNGEAGCITAGAFMAHFAGETPFAHLDISPMSWMTKPHDLGPAGATGVMVTTLAAFAL